MRTDLATNLLAMLEARRAYEAADEERNSKWKVYIDAQSAFTGKFAETKHPLGPFVVGETLVEHHPTREQWPQSSEQFRLRKVIRCPTSD